MAMTMKTDGVGELGEMLAKLEGKANEVAAYALYEGAAVVADSFKAAAGSIATQQFQYAKEGQTRLPSPEEKAAVMG